MQFAAVPVDGWEMGRQSPNWRQTCVRFKEERRNAMRPIIFCTGLAAVLAAVGCQADSAKNPYPNDPLLLSKKPAERAMSIEHPTLIARSEPQAPSIPATAFASRRLPSPAPTD